MNVSVSIRNMLDKFLSHGDWDLEIIAVVIFLLIFVLNASAWLVQRYKLVQRDAQRSTLMSNISELRKEAARYNTPATYAKCAKCQRQINAMEKQLFTLEASDGKKTQWQDQALSTVRIVKVVGGATLAVILFGRPLAYLPPDALNMARWLAMPHGKKFSVYGAIAVIPWMLLCDRASGMLVRAMLPAYRSTKNKAVDSKVIAEGKKFL